MNNQPTQPSTIAIHTSHPATKNCNRACLFATAFLPTLKTIFSGRAVLLFHRLMIKERKIIENKSTPAANML
jgi:hypothetical protein